VTCILADRGDSLPREPSNAVKAPANRPGKKSAPVGTTGGVPIARPRCAQCSTCNGSDGSFDISVEGASCSQAGGRARPGRFPIAQPGHDVSWGSRPFPGSPSAMMSDLTSPLLTEQRTRDAAPRTRLTKSGSTCMSQFALGLTKERERRSCSIMCRLYYRFDQESSRGSEIGRDRHRLDPRLNHIESGLRFILSLLARAERPNPIGCQRVEQAGHRDELFPNPKTGGGRGLCPWDRGRRHRVWLVRSTNDGKESDDQDQSNSDASLPRHGAEAIGNALSHSATPPRSTVDRQNDRSHGTVSGPDERRWVGGSGLRARRKQATRGAGSPASPTGPGDSPSRERSDRHRSDRPPMRLGR